MSTRTTSTISTRETINHDLTGAHPFLRTLEAQPHGYGHVVVEATIGSRVIGASDEAITDGRADLGDPFTIRTSIPALRALAEGILEALDEQGPAIEQLINRPPLGRVHGS